MEYREVRYDLVSGDAGEEAQGPYQGSREKKPARNQRIHCQKWRVSGYSDGIVELDKRNVG